MKAKNKTQNKTKKKTKDKVNEIAKEEILIEKEEKDEEKNDKTQELVKEDVKEIVKKNKSNLLSKLGLFILIMGYLIYFIYSYVTTDYDINNKVNLFKLALLFISIFTLGLTILTNKGASLFFSILTYILILCLIGITIIELIPQKEEKAENKSKDAKLDKGTMLCTGATSISDNTTIEVDYNGDTVNKIVYTYNFELDDEENAQTLQNEFNNEYKDIDNIYSEISISDNIVVTLTYNLEKFDTNKYLDKIENKTSLNKLNEVELNKLSCKNRS